MPPRSRKSNRRSRFAASVMLVAFAIISLRAWPATAQDDAPLAFVFPYNVDIVVNDDGSLDVTEEIWVRSARGVLTAGDRWIPTDASDGISDVKLVPSQPNSEYRWQQIDFAQLDALANPQYPALPPSPELHTGYFSVRDVAGDPDRVRIDFVFPYPIAKGNFFVLVLTYHVAGGLRSYPDADPPVQQLWWTAIGAEFAASVPVDKGAVTVTLPGAVDLDDVIASHNGVRDNVPTLVADTDGRTFSWTFDQTLTEDGFDIRLQFPWVATEANVPDWQREMDRDARVEQWLHLVLLIVGIGGASVGGVALGMWWFAKGRDPVVVLVADELTEPPSALSPWLAGGLLDESVDSRDIAAMLLDLQGREVVSISGHEVNARSVQHWNIERKLTLRALPRQCSLAETLLLEAAFGRPLSVGTETTLSTAAQGIVAALPQIRDAIYDDLVTQGLMVASPARTRRRWRIAGVVVAITGALIGLGGAIGAEPLTLVPMVAFVGLGSAMIGFAKAMPCKTARGAEQAALWRAYQRYLRKSLPRADDPERLRRHLPYTIALGTDLAWVNEILARGRSESTGWRERIEEFFAGATLLDGNWEPRTPHGDWSPPPYLGTPSGGEFDIPVPGAILLDRMSTGAGRGISTASDEGFGVLDGLVLLLEIGSIFLGGGKGGGGGGGSFR